MKKAKYIFSILISLFMICYITDAYCNSLDTGKAKFTVSAAEPSDSEKDISNELRKNIYDSIKYENTLTLSQDVPEITASECMILDMTTDRIIYNKNAYTKVPMASTTKIMTFIVAIENCEDINETVTVSANAAATPGSTMHLAEGETISLHDLLYGLLLNSGNDAAVAISEHIGGSIEAFADMMNEKALKLGALNTKFKTPHGLDEEGHYTTAYDLSIISKNAYTNSLFRKIIGTKSITLNGHFLKNTNPFLGSYENVTGGKTGFTSEAGKCIVFFVEKDSFCAVCVILGCPTSESRVSDGAKMIDYLVDNFNTYKIFNRGLTIDTFPVTKGLSKTVKGIIDDNVYITLAKWEEPVIDITYERSSKSLSAPISKSSPLGNIEIYCCEDYILNIDVISENRIIKKSYFNHLGDIIETLPDLML